MLAKQSRTPLSLLLLLLLSLLLRTTQSQSSTETFVFGGCSNLKYTPGSPYETGVNSVLTSIVNSATFTTYNNFTIPSTTSSKETLSGLFQCRGDLNSDACSRCVRQAVSQVGTLCLDSCGGALQLEGCFIKYDNATFLGEEDKTVVVKKCGSSVGYDSDGLTRRESVLAYLGAGGAAGNSNGFFRTSNSGGVNGVAQCVGDLSPAECQDCLSDAVQTLRTECGPASWGDVYLAKCYARFSEGGYHSRGGKDDDNNDNEIEKTLAILIGLIAGVALLIVFLSFLRKVCEGGKGGK